MIQLYNAHCLEFLRTVPSKSVSLVLTDPPYEVSRETHFEDGGSYPDRLRKVKMDFGDWDNEFDCLQEVIEETYRILKPQGTLICFYDLWKLSILKDYMENAKYKQLRFIEWIKSNPVPINSKLNYLTNCREIALLGVKTGKPTFHSEYDKGIYTYPICQDKGRFHTTQKPLALIQDLVLKHSNEGDCICDCFSGSGTTAVVSYKNNRDFIGCEINKEYFEKSVLRLQDEGAEVISC